MAQEVVPVPVELNNPQSIFPKALGDRGPTAKVAKVTELQNNIVASQGMIQSATQGEEGMSDVAEIIKQKLEAAEKDLAKAQKDAPSQLSNLKAVQEARITYFTASPHERR